VFSDIGLAEVLVVLFVMLVVGKPEDLPVVMRKLGVAVAFLQSFMRGMVLGWQENITAADPPGRGKRP